jgi:hypothetical protein
MRAALYWWHLRICQCTSETVVWYSNLLVEMVHAFIRACKLKGYKLRANFPFKKLWKMKCLCMAKQTQWVIDVMLNLLFYFKDYFISYFIVLLYMRWRLRQLTSFMLYFIQTVIPLYYVVPLLYLMMMRMSHWSIEGRSKLLWFWHEQGK